MINPTPRYFRKPNRKILRKTYENKQQLGIDSIEQFSYSNIGNKLCI